MLLFLLCALVEMSYAESVTLSTYYPAPFGAYDRLQLVPRAALPIPCNPGTLYVETPGTLRYCGDNGQWGFPSGTWEQTGDDIYPTDTSSNPDLQIGIGTTAPQSILHIYKSSAFMAEYIQNPRTVSGTTTSLILGKDFNESAHLVYKYPAFASFNGAMLRAGTGAEILALVTSKNTAPIVFLTGGELLANERMRIDANGNIGIGISTPTDKLHVVGGNIVNEGGDIYTTGRVGIGTTNPTQELQVIGNVQIGSPFTPGLRRVDIQSSDDQAKLSLLPAAGSDAFISFHNGAVERWWIYQDAPSNNLLIVNPTGPGGPPVYAVTVSPDGNVGIGSTSPNAKLDVDGNIKATLSNVAGIPNMHYDSGTREIGYDVAELFETTEEVEVGDVLVIDETVALKLKKSREPYDRGVVGIVSGAPAILFEGSHLEIAPVPGWFTRGRKPPVSLSGRILCKVSTENGPIKPKDL